eukprot:sb/3472497/
MKQVEPLDSSFSVIVESIRTLTSSDFSETSHMLKYDNGGTNTAYFSFIDGSAILVCVREIGKVARISHGVALCAAQIHWLELIVGSDTSKQSVRCLRYHVRRSLKSEEVSVLIDSTIIIAREQKWRLIINRELTRIIALCGHNAVFPCHATNGFKIHELAQNWIS